MSNRSPEGKVTATFIQMIPTMKMTKSTLLVSLVLGCSIGLWSWTKLEKPTIRKISVPVSITICGSFPIGWNDTIKTPPAKIIEGLGNLHYPVTTTSTKAQEFFEQGLR